MANHLYQKFAAHTAIFAGVAGFLYAVSFVIVTRVNPDAGSFMSALFLLVTGLVVAATQIGLYQRLRQTDEGFALLGLWLTFIGAAGMIIHGGYDLANIMNPPDSNLLSLAEFPSQIDPRGLLSFGMSGLGVLVLSWLMINHKNFPNSLANLGYFSAALSIILYLGRLILLDPTHPLIALVAIISGFIVGPWWYFWVGVVLSKR